MSKYSKCNTLCVVKCLEAYLCKTENLRGIVDALFISLQPPPFIVNKQTISRWLKDTLDLAGIDVSTYKGHSFRHASTSKASRNSANLDVIFSRAGWSKGSKMFARFYNRPIDERCTFAEAVMK